jgi:glutaredoxin-like YruB-family protein
MSVKVYSTPTCPYCQQAKEYFKEKNIEFEEVDVAQDQKAAQEMIEKTGQMGVPVIEINGEYIIGFNKAKVNELLNIEE